MRLLATGLYQATGTNKLPRAQTRERAPDNTRTSDHSIAQVQRRTVISAAHDGQRRTPRVLQPCLYTESLVAGIRHDPDIVIASQWIFLLFFFLLFIQCTVLESIIFGTRWRPQ